MFSEHVCSHLILSEHISMCIVVQVLPAYTNTKTCSQSMFVHTWYSQVIYLCTLLHRYYQPIHTLQHALRACLYTCDTLRAYIYVHCCTGTTSLYKHYSMLSEHVCTHVILSGHISMHVCTHGSRQVIIRDHPWSRKNAIFLGAHFNLWCQTDQTIFTLTHQCGIPK